MSRRPASAALLLAASLSLTAAAGCSGTAATTTTAHSPAATHAAAQAAATSSAVSASAAPSPSQVLCLTHACIVEDADQIAGNAASDGSVIAKMNCDPSTVKHVAPGEFTADCTATYSDATRWYGIATVQPSKGQVSWEPEYQE